MYNTTWEDEADEGCAEETRFDILVLINIELIFYFLSLKEFLIVYYTCK